MKIYNTKSKRWCDTISNKKLLKDLEGVLGSLEAINCINDNWYCFSVNSNNLIANGGFYNRVIVQDFDGKPKYYRLDDYSNTLVPSIEKFDYIVCLNNKLAK